MYLEETWIFFSSFNLADVYVFLTLWDKEIPSVSNFTLKLLQIGFLQEKDKTILYKIMNFA
jgi:hypothetical protein